MNIEKLPIEKLWQVNRAKGKNCGKKICITPNDYLSYNLLPIFIKNKIRVYEYDWRTDSPYDADLILNGSCNIPKLPLSSKPIYYMWRHYQATDLLRNDRPTIDKDKLYRHKIYKDIPNLYWMGDEWLNKEYSIPNQYIKTPWGEIFWWYKEKIEKRKLQPFVSIENKQGWTWIISKDRPCRDAVAKWLFLNQKVFTHKHLFVYDSCPVEYKSILQPYMFREIYNTDKSSWRLHHQQFLGFPSDNYLINTEKNYENFVIDIVTETLDYDGFGVQEKTLKPILNKMLFIVVGVKNYLKKLRKLGFKTFHPYLDESYDNENDNTIRLEIAMDSLYKFLSKKNNLKYQHELQSIVDHNFMVLEKIVQIPQEEKLLKRVLKRHLNIDLG